MQRFWAAGYAATSVRDLGDAMGLGPASVYNAFGDKRSLFADSSDREQSVHSIMNTDSGDHEHVFAPA